jgi:hypothetical protein
MIFTALQLLTLGVLGCIWVENWPRPVKTASWVILVVLAIVYGALTGFKL